MSDDQQFAKKEEPIAELFKFIGIALGVVVGGFVGLFIFPIALPALIVRMLGPHLTPRVSFWTVPRWHWLWTAGGVIAVVALLLFELSLLGGFVRSGEAEAIMATENPLSGFAAVLLPWGLVNIAAGLLLLPLCWTLYRRRTAWLVWKRRHPDVIEAEAIASARRRAADVISARSIGVRLDNETGQIVKVSDRAMLAPLPQREGRQAFGIVNRSTVTTLPELFRDVRRVREWIDGSGRFMLVPASSGSVRAVILAESGTGKTYLINALIVCLLELGIPIVFLDAKGDPADAVALRAYAESYGHTVSIGGNYIDPETGDTHGWNFWTGTADQVTTKLMRLMPPPDGANQHYLDEIRGVLQAIQSRSALRSVHDLRHRLTEPKAYVRDTHDLDLVEKVVTREGETAGQRVMHALLVALRPLERFIDDRGWSYGDRHADLTIVPLSPIDDAQAAFGDLLLVDLRAYIARRLDAGDKSPFITVVDEFPQLVTDASDPGDQAASLFETMRSAGAGLIIASQSVTGLSKDEVSRRRVMSSGVALLFGRSKDPEEVVKLAGTKMQLESSGQAAGDGLNSARAQHTYLVPIQDVREAADGSFWIVQGGAIAPFRGLPIRPRATEASTSAEDVDEKAIEVEPVGS